MNFLPHKPFANSKLKEYKPTLFTSKLALYLSSYSLPFLAHCYFSQCIVWQYIDVFCQFAMQILSFLWLIKLFLQITKKKKKNKHWGNVHIHF